MKKSILIGQIKWDFFRLRQFFFSWLSLSISWPLPAPFLSLFVPMRPIFNLSSQAFLSPVFSFSFTGLPSISYLFFIVRVVGSVFFMPIVLEAQLSWWLIVPFPSARTFLSSMMIIIVCISFLPSSIGISFAFPFFFSRWPFGSRLFLFFFLFLLSRLLSNLILHFLLLVPLTDGLFQKLSNTFKTISFTFLFFLVFGNGLSCLNFSLNARSLQWIFFGIFIALFEPFLGFFL